MPLPAVKPGGASFPIFNGQGLTIGAQTYDNDHGPQDAIVTVQFDFSNTTDNRIVQVNGAVSFKYFIVDFSSIAAPRILKRMKSLSISIDFDPLLAHPVSDYSPLQFSDSTTGQLLYLGGNFDSNDATTGALASACFPLLTRIQSQVMFSKPQNKAGNFVGAGVAIFSTFGLPPFVSNTLG